MQDDFLQQKRHLRRDVLVGCVGWIEESTHPYSPFCYEDTARCTNLHESVNNIATMNMRIYEVVSGYIAGIANSDT